MGWLRALPLLLTLSSTLCHPYGPPASSSQHRQQKQPSPSSYQTSGNDQLRFHPEESQYFTPETSNNAAPSYADLLNLQQQEAQQQAIIDAQKKLETNKLQKDIEFIQRQQEMLQQQIHQQEIKNEQKLNYQASHGTSGSYNAPQSNPGAYNPVHNNPGKFNSGQWSPDNNANKFDDGLYKGEGGHVKAPSDGSYACDGGCTDASKSSNQNFQQSTSFQQKASSQFSQSATQTASGYGGSSGSSSGPQSGGYPEFQSPEYPNPSPTAPLLPKPTGSYGSPAPSFPSKPSGSYVGSPSPSFPLPQYPPSQPPPPPSQYPPSKPQPPPPPPQYPPSQPPPPPPQYPPSQPPQSPSSQYPVNQNPSYGGSSSNSQYHNHEEQQVLHQNTQDYWWNGPNSPFSQNQLGNCNHLDCNPPPINKPSPPKPSYGPNPIGPIPAPTSPAVQPTLPPSVPAESVNIAQNPYLSAALNGKPQPPSYGPTPQSPTPSYAPPSQVPPVSYPPSSQSSSYGPVQLPGPSQEPYTPPQSNSPQEWPQKPLPSEPAYNPQSSPLPPLTNPTSPTGGYGQSGGGTPGISFPEYQPNDVQGVSCNQAGHTCVAKHLCVNGKVNTNGVGIIQLRITKKSCRADIEVCCQEQDDFPPTGSYSPPPTSGYGQAVDSYGAPSSPDTCNVCGASNSYSHQQSHEEETSSSYHHKESSASVSHGNMPHAKLPEFLPPAAAAQSHTPASRGYGK